MDMQNTHQAPPDTGAPLLFPIVGIGASAGGFRALAALLQNLPAAPGMALVIVLHLPADQQSNADRVLQQSTSLPVVQVHHATPILPNHVYVIPPARNLRMEDGHLVLHALERTPGDPATIGVVLSGMGSDGTAGLACIREQGGVTIAQAPADAGQPGMPQSAIDSGMADFVLDADRIPAKLVELRGIMQAIREHARHGHAAPEACVDLGPDPDQALDDVLALLHQRTGNDFRQYKRATLVRRLERRMQVRGRPDLRSYQALQQTDAGESHALMKDLLIGVTQFFRDREAFAALEHTVVPQIFRNKQPGDTVRVWVAACSTGEEAYSLAMLLADHAASLADPPAIQIFASDIDAQAIRTARAGLYPASIADDVPAERLQRYFTLENGAYKVRKTLRRHVLFAEHNLLHDPAFSSLDLVSCRNFLIYLNLDMHRHVLATFHFALRGEGFLMLGSAESADEATHLYAPVDANKRLYRAKPGSRPDACAGAVPAPTTLRSPAGPAGREEPLPAPPAAPRARSRLFSFADIHLHKAAEQAPPSILVDANSDIVHIAAQASPLLRHAGGEPTRDIVALVTPAWRLPLRTALFQAQKSGRKVSTGPVRYEHDGAARAVDMTVLPFHDEHAEGLLMLVSFRDVPDVPPSAVPTDERDRSLLDQLDEELRHTRHKLLETVEELKTTIEELRSANRQLEAALEKTHVANEELKSANTDLTQRLETLGKSHDDLNNLIASSDVATLFLDREMRIQRYTPRITDMFNVIPADVGRPLLHITSRLENAHLAEDTVRVFATLQPLEQEVRSRDGRDYIVRVHPYRTGSHRIDGAVMTFFDITSRRIAENALRESEQRLALAFAALPVGICTTDTAGNTIMYNDVMRRFLPTGVIPSRDPARATRWRGWDAAGAPVQSRDFPGARALRGESVLPGTQMLYVDDDGKEIWTEVRSQPLRDGAGNISGALVVVIDVDRLKRSEEAAQRNAQRAESVLEHMGDAHSVLDGNYRIVGVNAAAERLLGRPRAQLLGRSHWDAFPGSIDAPVGRAFRRVVEEGVEQHLTHHYTGEGYDLHLEVDAYPTDEGGLAMFWRDVTQRVRAEQALRASEEKYRALFNQMDEAYAVVEVMADAAGRWTDFLFLDVNAAFMRHTGMPYPVGQTATQLLGTPNPRWAELYGRAAQTGEPIRLEEPELALGLVFDLNIFRLGGEGSRQVAVLFTNITERKHADTALRESERRYRLLFENMREGFVLAEVLYDGDGRVVDALCLEGNPAAARLTGVPDLCGRRFSDFMRDAEARWLEIVDRVARTGTPERHERLAALGRWYDIHVSSAAEASPDEAAGPPRRVAILFHEINPAPSSCST
jgi:two-component system CheB/CheR fusion protein